MTTVSKLNLSCIELDLGLGFDNIDDIEFVLAGGWGGVQRHSLSTPNYS